MEAVEYDRQWVNMDDFMRFNPGARHRRRWILKALSRLEFNSLLDVGCGNAELLLLIREALGTARKLQCTGADLSPVAVDRNRKRLPEMSFEVLDVQKKALEQKFEMIVCAEVIEHLEDRASAFEHLSQMLLPNGHLVVTCPTGKLHETEKHFGHVSHPTIEEIRSHAQRNGLQLVKGESWGWPFYNWMKWATNIRPEWALKNFGDVQYSLPSKVVSETLYWLNFLNLPKLPLGCQLFLTLKKTS